MRTLFAIGLGLLAVSAPPLVLMARESMLSDYVAGRYSIDPLIVSSEGNVHRSVSATIGGHTVTLTDDQGNLPERRDFVEPGHEGNVSILVDGRARTVPVPSRIRLYRRGAERYFGYVSVMRLDDREGPERLVVAQDLGRGRYRTTSVFGDGTVEEDAFGWGEWCSPPVRSILIRDVVRVPIGFCSSVMQVYPSVFYPILYPWFSGFLGFATTAFAVIASLRRYARASSPPGR